MTNPFHDQERFMKACDQTVGEVNGRQFTLYLKLITEEYFELQESKTQLDQLDALIDILVVTIGAIHSMGADAEGAWREVMRSNLSKIDSNSGKVNKREDGKVLKPDGWIPPDLKPYLERK